MFVAWTKFSNPQGTGTLDIAIKDKKVQKISKLLGDVLPMNQQFFEMIADYFSKEISAKSDCGISRLPCHNTLTSAVTSLSTFWRRPAAGRSHRYSLQVHVRLAQNKR